MKQVFLLLAFLVCAEAQAQSKTTTTKKRKKTTGAKLVSRPPETYNSNNGKIKARSLGKYEQPDTVDKPEKDAKHVNSNYNESTPRLSPNSGSSAPITR